MEWTTIPAVGAPVGCRGHCLEFDPVTRRFVSFGGNSYKPFLGLPDWTKYDKMFNDVWVRDADDEVGDWTKLSPAGDLPGTRAISLCGYDATRNRLLVFGGLAYGSTGADGTPDFDDLWALDLSEGVESWTRIEPDGQRPPPRGGGASAYDPDTDRLVIMGGARFEAAAALDDLWVFDFPQSSWFEVMSPVPTDLVRAAHRMWHVPNAPEKSTFLVFGGLVGSVVQNDLWRVVIHPTGTASYDRLPIAPPLPPPRGSFAGALDSAGTLLIFGGTQTGINSLGDTWTLDTNAIWTALEVSGP